MKQKGFTLIELLAVIVILAIIALIATPIVLNIISDSRESATLQSAQFYMDAVENAVAKKMMDEPTFRPTTCDIQSDGNLKCGEFLVEVEIKGEKPTSGTITLETGQITGVTLVLSEKTITKNTEGKLVYGEPLELQYTIGDTVTFNPGDGDRMWNVIGEDKDTVTLMLTENLGNTVAWYAYSNHNSYDNSYGPKDALEYLNSLTKDWNNVDPIESYSYVNNLNGTAKPNGYQKIEINNGITTLTHKDGTPATLDETYKAKARLLTLEEIFEIATKVNPNLKEEKLRGYIEEYLEEIEKVEEFSEVSSQTTNEAKVDKVIEIMLDGDYNSSSKYFKTYITAIWLSDYIEVDYFKYDEETGTYVGDILFPSFLYQNLWSKETEQTELLPDGYWTLSAYADGSTSAWYVFCVGDVSDDRVDVDFGVRPVITVSKSKLK